jgi:hypothetical protein
MQLLCQCEKKKMSYFDNSIIKSFCGGLCAKRKAQSAGRKANNTIDAVRHAPCAFPLAAGGKRKKGRKK